MKLYNIFSVIGLAAAMAFTACTDEVDYTPAKLVTTPGAYFPAEEEVNFVINSEADVQTINISRQSTEGELTITVTPYGDTDKFSVPSTVTFANGAATASVVVTPLVNNMEMYATYMLGITIADEFTSPYIQNSWEGTFTYGVEWSTIGNCIYTDDACGPVTDNPILTWRVEIQEHATTPGLYRLVNPYGCATSPFRNFCKLSENYVIVNATNPAKVFFGDNPNDGFNTGVDLGYGIMTIKLQTYGTLENGLIKWPVKGLAVYDNDGGYYANTSGAFCIDLTDILNK